jgi:hypothetical protein
MSTPCRVTFDIAVMSIVIIYNATRAICMFLVVLKANDYPLVTLGDAIASFLETPDPTTKHRCLLSKRDILNGEFKKIAATAEELERGEREVDRYAVLCCVCSLLGLRKLLVRTKTNTQSKHVQLTERPSFVAAFFFLILVFGPFFSSSDSGLGALRTRISSDPRKQHKQDGERSDPHILRPLRAT